MRLFPAAPASALADLAGRIRRLEQTSTPPPVGDAVPFSFRDARRSEEAVPFGLRVAADIAWRVIVVAVALYGVGKIIGYTSTVVIPVAVALLLASLLMPVAVFLNRTVRLPRGLAAILTVLGGVGVVGGLLFVAGNQLVMGVRDLSDQVTEGLQQIESWLSTGPFAGAQLDNAVQQGRAWLENNAGTLTNGAVSGAITAGNVAVGTIMSLFALFFFLSDGDRMWAWVVRLAPQQVRTPIHEAGRRGWVTLGSYVKTQVVVAAVDAVFIAAGAGLLGLPLAVPLGLIVFFASAIPIVGAVASGALAVVLALVVKGPIIALAMIGVVVAVQQIEGNLLQPILMSKAVSLHPLATLLGVAAGSYLFGIAGALFAVPVMAVTNTVVLYLNGYDKFPMLAHGASVTANGPKDLAGPDDDHDHDEPTPRLGEVTPDRYVAEQQAEAARAQGRAAEVPVEDDGSVEDAPGR